MNVSWKSRRTACRMCVRCALPLLLALAVAMPLAAQTAGTGRRSPSRTGSDDFVYPAPNGVYVFCGFAIASAAHPSGDTVGYRVERRNAGGAWSRLADVSAVETLDAFRARTDTAKRRLLRLALKVQTDEALWDAILARPSLASIPVAGDRDALLALGLLSFDGTAAPGSAYQYRVSVLLRSGEAVLPRTSGEVRPGTPWPMKAMTVASAESDDSSAHIEWIAPNVRPFPAKMTVLRRMTGQEEYAPLQRPGLISLRNDSILCTVYDGGLRRNQRYDYMIQPEDFFGNQGPQSAEAAIYTVNATRLPLPQKLAADQTETGIRISWSTEGADYVQATRIYRSRYFDSGYVRIAEVPAVQGAYTDAGAEGMIRYYYRLTNVTFGGRESQRSAVVFGYRKSLLPPATPQEVRGKPFPRGVEIAWSPNRETDIAGYYVCRAATSADSLRPVSPLVDGTRFVDTSADLRGTVRYRYAVVAVSTSQQKSRFSADVWIRPQIATSPPPPRRVYTLAQPFGILVNWADAREDDATVMGYAVYRAEKNANAPSWSVIGKSLRNPDHLTWIDSTAVPGRTYLYAVASIDGFGGEGIRSMAGEAGIAVELPPPPDDLRVSRTEGGVLVEWDVPEGVAVGSFVIYRNERGGKPVKHATAPADARQYVDRKAKAGTVYYYSIALVDARGRESARTRAKYALP